MGRKSIACVVLMITAGAIVASCSGSPAPGPSPTPPTPPQPTTSSLRGTITTRDGALGNASVEVLDGANRGLIVTAAGDGTYRLEGLTRGTFGVRASFGDYAPDETRVSLTADQTQDFRLTRARLVGINELSLGLQPNRTYTMTGTLQNTGDACATQISGTLRIVIGSFQQTYPWSLPSAQVLRLGETTTYATCCLDANVAGDGQYFVTTVFQSTRC